MRRVIYFTVVVLALSLAHSVNGAPPELTPPPDTTPTPPILWEHYGSGVDGLRYSPASDITPANVATLEPKWCYQYGASGYGPQEDNNAGHEMTPIVTDNGGSPSRLLMYVCTPFNVVAAVDALTGVEVWKQALYRNRLSFKLNTCRGVSTWVNPALQPGALCKRTIFTNTLAGLLSALDAATGNPCPSFGTSGAVEVVPRNSQPVYENQSLYGITSPPLVVNDTVLVGSGISDDIYQNITKGAVNAYDPVTGKKLWTWSAVPTNPQDPAYKTWADGTANVGGGNVWSIMSAAPALGLVFVPTSSASVDPYGAARLGNNEYANSIVALKVKTGEVAWSYQTVHHDLWNYDVPSQPSVTTITINGTPTTVVVSWTKEGHLFVLNAATGKPVFGINEQGVPASSVPGEKVSPTQPVPEGDLGNLVPSTFNESMVWGATDADKQSCLSQLQALKGRGDGVKFTPPSTEGALHYPSALGGGNWGSVSIDPNSGMAYFNGNNFVMQSQLIARGGTLPAWCTQAWQKSPMNGTPYTYCESTMFSNLDGTGNPCNAPPWATLMAVDLTTASLKWKVPYGSTPAVNNPAYGSIKALGGVTTTASGIIFGAGTLDQTLHAVDAATGKTLWQSDQLPAIASATPMTYKVNGTQFVTINAGGNSAMVYGKPGDYVISFGLATPGQPPRTIESVCAAAGSRARAVASLRNGRVAARAHVVDDGAKAGARAQQTEVVHTTAMPARRVTTRVHSETEQHASQASKTTTTTTTAAAATATSGGPPKFKFDPPTEKTQPRTQQQARTRVHDDDTAPAPPAEAKTRVHDDVTAPPPSAPKSNKRRVTGPARTRVHDTLPLPRAPRGDASANPGSVQVPIIPDNDTNLKAQPRPRAAPNRTTVTKAQAQIDMGALEIKEGKRQIVKGQVKSAKARSEIRSGEALVAAANRMDGSTAPGSGSATTPRAASGQGSGATEAIQSATRIEGQGLLSEGERRLEQAADAVDKGRKLVKEAEADIAKGEKQLSQPKVHVHDDVTAHVNAVPTQSVWAHDKVYVISAVIGAMCVGVTLVAVLVRGKSGSFLAHADGENTSLITSSPGSSTTNTTAPPPPPFQGDNEGDGDARQFRQAVDELMA